jgi:F0F1-type ATP synthase assembly protein I
MADEPNRADHEDGSDAEGPPRRAVWFQYSEASSVGIEMVVSVTVCTVGAYYIERYLTHWSPWTTLIGVALGCMTAANAVVRAARSYQRSLRDQASEKNDESR